jgi:hypothetical protein
VPDAKDTSADAQTMIDEAPTVFKNRNTAANIPAPTNPNYRSSSNLSQFAKSTVDRTSKVSVKNRPSVNSSAVGYSKPYVSNRGLNPQNNGFPLTGVKRTVGAGSFPKAIKSRSGKMKTNLDIFNSRTLHEAGLTKL